MGSDSGGSHYDAGRTSSVEKAITDLIQGKPCIIQLNS